MNISEPFIRRPIATSLLMSALALVGIVAFPLLPVAPLPQVDFPTIQVTAQFAGASADTMAATVATPLEEQFGQIAGVTQLTSNSVLGTSVITLQFDLNRNIDGAAQDVQAAITAAGKTLPQNLTVPPYYKKVNPADTPILILAAHSDTLPLTSVDDFAENVLAQQISQISGVALVNIGGQQKPSIRVQVDPAKLQARGLTLEDVRGVLATATVDAAKGAVNGALQTFTISTNDQLTQPEQYDDVIIGYRAGAPIRVRDVGHAITGPQDITQSALASLPSGVTPGILLLIYKQPGANVISTVDAIQAAMPRLAAIAPQGLKVDTIIDRTQTIRASVKDVEFTLAITISLVVMVILVFLRNIRATLIPSVTVPLALLGSTALMYLFGFSLDNLSLMALTIAVGFVVDDAIVVVENIYRHLEAGTSPMQSALKGASEIGFTVVSISVSLVAVFIPLLLMGGIIGRLFREFAITVTACIAVSVVVSLTLTPMLASRFLAAESEHHGRIYNTIERGFEVLVNGYKTGLDIVLRHQFITLMVFFATMACTGVLFVSIPKGFFPVQDTGAIQGIAYAAQDVSPDRMRGIQKQLSDVLARDPDIAAFGSFFGNGGGNTLNTARFFLALKPRDERKASAMDIINRLRPQLAKVEGVQLFLQPSQDITVGGRISAGQYQFTMQDPSFDELSAWAPKMLAKLKTLPELADVSTDQQTNAPLLAVTINRDAAARFGIQAQEIELDTERRVWPGRRRAIFHASELLFRRARNPSRIAEGSEFTEPDLRQGAVDRAARAAVDFGQFQHQYRRTAFGLASVAVPGGDTVVQSEARRRARRRGDGHPTGRRRHGHASDRHHRLPGQCTGVPDLTVERADLDRGGACGRLCDPRRALRELRPSADHSIDAAVRGRRRPAGAVARRLRPLGDRHHRHHPAHRHREKERHHAGRLCHHSRARGIHAGSRHPRRMLAAFPSDHDDDHGHFVWWLAADARHRLWLGAAPAARLRDGWRLDREPDANPVHHAGGLSLSRPPAELAQWREIAPRRHRRGAA